MAMDHNYARGKLTLLLRDLSNYNGGEFWREMSRIASGATASIHAEGLKAERDALADSNTQFKQQNEAQIRMNAKLMRERDALAAHVQQLTNIAEKISTVAPEYLDHLAADAAFVLRSSPDSSLARRDAIKEAEAVEQWADCLESIIRHVETEHSKDPNYPAIGAEGMGEFAADMREAAARLRKKTEGHQ